MIPPSTVRSQQQGPLVIHAPLAASALLAALFGLTAMSGEAWPVRLFWWLGPLAGLGRAIWSGPGLIPSLLKLFSAAFFWLFATHFIDVRTTQISFEAGHVGMIFAVFFVLRAANVKLYHVVAEGGELGGGISWVLYVLVIALLSWWDLQQPYFSDFSYFAGQSPWGFLWFGLALLLTAAKFVAHKKTPMNLRSCAALLKRTQQTLQAGLPQVLEQAAALKDWADRLVQALEVSSDPLVSALSPMRPSFLEWQLAAKDLQNPPLNSPDVVLVTNDLVRLAEDFGQLIEQLSLIKTQTVDLPRLRVSPFLLTRGR